MASIQPRTGLSKSAEKQSIVRKTLENIGKERVKALQAVYTKFDKHDNGWVDVPDLPVIIATHLGSRNPPEALTMQAVKQVAESGISRL